MAVKYEGMNFLKDTILEVYNKYKHNIDRSEEPKIVATDMIYDEEILKRFMIGEPSFYDIMRDAIYIKPERIILGTGQDRKLLIDGEKLDMMICSACITFSVGNAHPFQKCREILAEKEKLGSGNSIILDLKSEHKKDAYTLDIDLDLEKYQRKINKLGCKVVIDHLGLVYAFAHKFNQSMSPDLVSIKLFEKLKKLYLSKNVRDSIKIVRDAVEKSFDTNTHICDVLQ